MQLLKVPVEALINHDVQGTKGAHGDTDEVDPLDAFMEDVGTAVKQDLKALAPEVANEAITANPALEKAGIKLDESTFEDTKVAAAPLSSAPNVDMQDVADFKVKEEPDIQPAAASGRKLKSGARLTDRLHSRGLKILYNRLHAVRRSQWMQTCHTFQIGTRSLHSASRLCRAKSCSCSLLDENGIACNDKVSNPHSSENTRH
jgi:hypothetical protein